MNWWGKLQESLVFVCAIYLFIYFQGTMEYIPVNFLYKSVPFDDLVTLYMASDCCIVSSTRDGMNLVWVKQLTSINTLGFL